MHQSNPADYKLSLSPYPGLRSFRKEENDIFFGRDDHVDLLIAKLARAHFVCVTGPSGCGKSSLVRTGLQNSLEAGFLPGRGSDWIFCDFTPGDRPLEAMTRTLAKACAAAHSARAQEGMAAASEEEIHGLLDSGVKDARSANDLNRILAPLDFGGRPILLFVDQFEELFRYAQHEPHAAVKFAEIMLKTAAAKSDFYVVITIRTDELEKCARYTGLTRAINESQFLTPTLDRYQVQEAIEGPIAIFGGKIDAKLTIWLLNSLDEELDKLPLMQHALKLLYAHKTALTGRPDVTLGLEEFTDIFRIDMGPKFSASESGLELRKTLSRRLDRIYRGLPPRLKPAAARTFCALTATDGGSRDIRRPLPLAALARTIGESEDDTRLIVKSFADGDESYLCLRGGEEGIVDVPHECILRLWSRLQKSWLANESQSAENIKLLAQYASNWDEGARRATFADKLLGPDLLKGHTLQRFREWRDKARPNGEWAARYLSAPRGSTDRRDAGETLSPNEIYAKISALFDASERHRRMSRVAVRAGALAIVGLAMIVTLGVKHSIDSSRRLEELRAGLKVLQSETATALLPYPADSIGTAVMKTKEAQELRDEASSELAVGSLWQSLAATREIARVTEDASIVGAALMSDERALLALDSRGTVHRWPLDRQYRPGTAFTATPGSTLSVGGSLALTRRGEVAAVGYGDGSIRLFNLTLAGLDGRPLLRNGTNPHPKDVSELVFSPDGTVLVSSSLDGTIVLWTREPTAPSGFQVNGAESWHPRLLGTAFAPAAVELTALDIRQEKDAIAFGRSDGQVCILKLDPGAAAKCNGEVHVRGESVKAVRFVPGRSALVSAGNDDSIAIWDLTPDLALSPTARRLFEDSDILDIDVSDDGQLIASASKDGSVRVYDAARLQLLAILLGHRDQVRVVRFGTASHVLVSGSLDRTARIWSPFEARSTVAGLGYRLSSRDANGSQLKVGTVAVGGSGKWVAFGADSSIYVKDADREEVSILTNESGADRSAGGEIAELSRLATHPTLPIVLASSRRPQIAVWRRAVKLGWMRRIVPLPGDVLPDARPRPMAISPDGRMLAVAISQDRQFIILVCPMARGGGWACTPSVGTLAKRFLIKPHDEGRGAGWPTSLAFSGSGRFLAVGDSNGAVRAFDLNAPLSDEELYTGHKRAVNAVSFSPDESSLVSASGDKTVMIWNRASRALRTTLKEHNDDVSGVAYSATGKFIVSVSKDKKVILWNAENGKMLARLPAGRNGILSLDVKITPMGSLMAIGSSGGKLDVMRFFESAEEIVGYSETYLKDNIRFAPEGS